MKHLARRAAAAAAAWLLVLGGCSGSAPEAENAKPGPVSVGQGLLLAYSGDCSGERQNLEDCMLLDARTAGRIRAIVRSTHPAVQRMKELERTANVWLETNMPDAASITGLTESETQIAAAAAIRSLFGEDQGSYSQNVTALKLYLGALSPIVPEQLVLSDNSIHIRSAQVVGQEDGMFSVTVEFTTHCSWQTGDDLTVAVSCGDTCRSFCLPEGDMEDVHCITIPDVSEPGEVRVEISGWQRRADVFLFDGSVIAYDDRRLPAYGEARAGISGDRILTIHADSGVVFEIYRVAELWELLSGLVMLNGTPTAEEMEQYAVAENLIAEIRAGEEGTASLNLTAKGCPDGVYLVMERSTSGAGQLAEPFYVTLPQVSPEGEERCGHIVIQVE